MEKTICGEEYNVDWLVEEKEDKYIIKKTFNPVVEGKNIKMHIKYYYKDDEEDMNLYNYEMYEFNKEN